ncbi:virulence protein E, partial [Parabacteroides distasonis]
DDIKNFLRRSIQIRQNVISGRIEFFDTGAADGEECWKPFVDRTLNTLWTDLAQHFRVRKADIESVVNSAWTPLFNPFLHYLERLPKWQEGDHDYIADLAATVKVKGNGVLSFCEVLRKWLVAML